MKKLGERNYELIRHGVKSEGTYDPDLIFCFFEERLYVNEWQEIHDFLKWVNADVDNRQFGSGNYEQRFAQFKAQQKTLGVS